MSYPLNFDSFHLARDIVNSESGAYSVQSDFSLSFKGCPGHYFLVSSEIENGLYKMRFSASWLGKVSFNRVIDRLKETKSTLGSVLRFISSSDYNKAIPSGLYFVDGSISIINKDGRPQYLNMCDHILTMWFEIPNPVVSRIATEACEI